MNTTVEAVLLRLRRDLLDTIQPYLWLDEELIDYIDEGQREFCREVPIRDSRTKEVTQIKYKAGDFELPISSAILEILTVIRLDSNGNTHRVPMRTQENLVEMFRVRSAAYGADDTGASQLTEASDLFEVLVDYDENYIRLSTPAATDGTLLLQVDRLPINELTNCDDVLEVRREYEPGVRAWAAHCAWRKQDAETFDERAARDSFDLFQYHTDKARIAHKRRTMQSGTMKYGGI